MYFLFFRRGYLDRDVRFGAVHHHGEEDLALGQYQTKLFDHAFFSSPVRCYMIQQKPHRRNSYTAAKHSGFKMSPTNLFVNV